MAPEFRKLDLEKLKKDIEERFHKARGDEVSKPTISTVDKAPAMKILRVVFVSALLPTFVFSVYAQTAHDYFNELKAANTFNHYKDEYVCFSDEELPSFSVIARVSDVIVDMKKAGDTEGIKKMVQAKDSLLVQTYFKSVASDGYLYEPVKKVLADDSREYFVEFKSPKPGKMVYAINWTTGRYLLRVYIFQNSRTIPAKEGSGRCELIHPKLP
jgi:hypothetical protein